MSAHTYLLEQIRINLIDWMGKTNLVESGIEDSDPDCQHKFWNTV